MSGDILAVGDISVRGMRSCEGGLRVAECFVPSAAVTLLRQQTYRAVVCDFRLPDFDCMELMRLVRSNHPNLPFVLAIEPRDLRHGLLAMIDGASGYLVTPDEPKKLAESLAAAFRRHSLGAAVGAKRQLSSAILPSNP